MKDKVTQVSKRKQLHKGDLLLIETDIAFWPDVLDRLKQGAIHGPFSNMDEIHKWMKTDAESHFELDSAHWGKDREWGSIMAVVKVEQFLKVIPNVSAVFEVEDVKSAKDTTNSPRSIILKGILT